MRLICVWQRASKTDRVAQLFRSVCSCRSEGNAYPHRMFLASVRKISKPIQIASEEGIRGHAYKYGFRDL
jgi:hypothetical protein